MGNITNGTILGAAFPSSVNAPLKAMSFTTGGQLYLVQVANSYPLTIVVRGRQLLNDANVDLGYATRNSNYSEADLAVLAESEDGNGFNTPTSFRTPTGWIEKFDEQYGNAYYVKSSDVEAQASGDTDGDGVPDTVRSANYLDTAVAWVKANPLLTVAIVVGLYLALKPKSSGRGKGKSFLGGLLA